jgi:hypothetical protein
MAKALFITRQDLVTFTSANGNLDPDKFLPYIRIAQDIHMQNYLGTDLYEKIEALITAGTLTLVDNPNYFNLVKDYCKDMLIYWAMVEYLPYAGINITNSGIFSTQPENSTVLDKDRIDSLIEKARDTAQHYTRRFIDYMNFNQSTFPEYTSNSNGDVHPDDVADFGGWVL